MDVFSSEKSDHVLQFESEEARELMKRKMTVDVCDETGFDISVVSHILYNSADRARSISYLFD